MKIHELKFSHYRSFGNEAWISFESNIVALIGRNGVGKTNAIEAISRLKFFTNDVVGVIPANAVNQNSGLTPELTVHAELDDDDMAELGDLAVGYCGHASRMQRNVAYCFTYDKSKLRTRMSYAGLFFNCMQYHQQFIEIRNECTTLADYLEKNKIYNSREYVDLIEALRDYDTFYVPNLSGTVAWAKNALANRVDESVRKMMTDLLDKFFDRVGRAYAAFAKISPKIFRFEDAAEFPNAYRLDDIVAWDQNNRLCLSDRIALDRFLGAVGSSRAELIRAFQENDERERTRLQSKIANAARRLSKEFNQSYLHGNADVELDVRFDGNVLRFSVGNADIPGNVIWADASAGVRWYLCAFLELRKALLSRTAIILVDEPAIHLHVNAQREALALMQRLATGTKHIVYTTHSPYMMDMARLGDVRAIVRDGDVSVVKTITAIESVDCRHEVLTPVCHALGYSMTAGLVPNASRLHILVEGVSDAIYIHAMMRVLGIGDEDKPFIVPCQGAPSVPYVVPLFIAWGLRFKVLFDHDAAGLRAGDVIRKHYGSTVDVRYVGGDARPQIESLISASDYRKVCGEELDAMDLNKSKMVKARRFAALVDSRLLQPDPDTCRNFAELLGQLELDVDSVESIYEDYEAEAFHGSHDAGGVVSK